MQAMMVINVILLFDYYNYYNAYYCLHANAMLDTVKALFTAIPFNSLRSCKG